jgi:hypothetical protein
MYILQSIQECGGEKIGVYFNASNKSNEKYLRKAQKLIDIKGNPSFAIFSEYAKLSKGEYGLRENKGSFLSKADCYDNTKFIEFIKI